MRVKGMNARSTVALAADALGRVSTAVTRAAVSDSAPIAPPKRATRQKRRVSAKKAPAESTANDAEHRARVSLRPTFGASLLLHHYSGWVGELDIVSLTNSMSDDVKDVLAGDMNRVESMLFSQATALQGVFVNLAVRATQTTFINQREIFMRMALKAQNQCRMTLETLATIKNPPVIYARQANIANGAQQVNNGVVAPARSREYEIEQSKLLEAQDGERLDPITTSGAIGSDPTLETVGAIDGTTNR